MSAMIFIAIHAASTCQQQTIYYSTQRLPKNIGYCRVRPKPLYLMRSNRFSGYNSKRWGYLEEDLQHNITRDITFGTRWEPQNQSVPHPIGYRQIVYSHMDTKRLLTTTTASTPVPENARVGYCVSESPLRGNQNL
ncbi:uncharacterized protein EDB93DRAFT_1099143 [Suillus bovinus]|uniref:uncharacterized protein n=1 Tax=Suillus bovinus TaxID=48563 RepID=UPI001B876236|nr:uncharacterized protein EDB93DRAFT_1099143 [Suillus bovinus]KAG2159631.1 hypothetical protein EDB93DRAFT_1099143 [Suillus bovinus]